MISLVVGFFWLIALVNMLIEVFSAPEGYEDSRGFHLGKEPINRN